MPFDHFNFIAPLYDRIFNYYPSPDLNRFLNLPTHGRLLDLGGGTGRVSQSLRGFASQALVVDFSRKMLKQAATKSLLTVCARGEQLPFQRSTFSRVLMVDALHHVQNQVDTINELCRVIEPGGRIVILEPDIQHFRVKLVALFEKVMLMRSHFLSGAEIVDLFPSEGGKVEVHREGINILMVYETVEYQSLV